MRTKVIFFALVFSPVATCIAQTVEWIHTIGGSGIETVVEVGHDQAGNIILTGNFIGTVDFDPGPGIHELTAPSGAGYVLKLAADGSFQWVYQMTNTIVSIRALAVSEDGNIVVGNNATNEILLLGPDGTLLWSMTAPLRDAAFFGDHIYITGHFSGTADFDPTPGVFNLTSAGFSDAFIGKYTMTGELVWVGSVGGTSADGPRALALGPDGSVYVTGMFTGTADLDPGPGEFVVTAPDPADGQEQFLLKLDSDGAFEWAVMVAGPDMFNTGVSPSDHIAVDDLGRVNAFFAIAGEVDVQPGVGTVLAAGNGGMLIRFAPDGTFQLAKRIDTPFVQTLRARGTDLFVVGSFIGTVDADPGPGTTMLTSAGNGDGLILRLNDQFELVHAGHVAGAFQGGVGSIAVDADGAYTAVGIYSGTFDLDPGPAVQSFTSTGSSQDVFIIHLSDDISTAIRVRETPGLKLYPNPSNDIIWLEIDQPGTKDTHVLIFDPMGRQVYSSQLTNSLRIAIPIEGLADGFYHVQVVQDGVPMTSGFIKH